MFGSRAKIGYIKPEHVFSMSFGVPCNDWERSGPEKIRQRMKIPDVELIMQRSAEAHSDEVRRKQYKHNVCKTNSLVKVGKNWQGKKNKHVKIICQQRREHGNWGAKSHQMPQVAPQTPAPKYDSIKFALPPN